MTALFDRRSLITAIAAAPLIGCSEARKTGSAAAPPMAVPQRVASPGGLVEIKGDTTGIRLDLRYATAANFTGRTLYSEARAFLQDVATEVLLRARDSAMKEGYGLSIFDAYRPWRVTKQLWDATPAQPA